MNIELHEYKSPDQRTETHRQTDWGASHIGIRVEDLRAAAEYLSRVDGCGSQGYVAVLSHRYLACRTNR